jgi:hypothetical protein
MILIDMINVPAVQQTVLSFNLQHGRGLERLEGMDDVRRDVLQGLASYIKPGQALER